jgi:hypothetical protein
MSTIADPVHELVHDHTDLNRRVLEIGAMLASGGPSNGAPAHGASPASTGGRARLVVVLKDLREVLFFHFAREEEGLFPFVAERLPELAERVTQMAVAHDSICGALARMVHVATAGTPAITAAAAEVVAELATSPGELSVLRALFERFQTAYADHARFEADLLRVLDDRLDASQREQLAELVRDL